eukprot:NODE_1887_length_1767_cov_42.545620_g1604_i0.p1 GENE.NODE_1887_length_1767_cov_42.545620_g1604_i0~~NODE_1887_length_1767_cov_42.545620_g1604_i0.p1  ORF type:complete len:523 (+),score=123.05 NODE_1887_length_1767_cov_42.545620_g1604_i0:95-1663(+)
MEKYQRLKVIGKGAFGEAVLVKSLVDGELYVAKEIVLSQLNKKDREATDTEIKILATVDHPNITRFIESFQEGGNLYIVMEYADGGDLHSKMKQRLTTRTTEDDLPFTEEQIRSWFVQLCLALQHLHHLKILHRDLKTRNIFMTSNGLIKLGDFGLSTVLKNTLAQAHTLCGTPYYFSPELCKNKPYNSKSDVWALGCILYEMCTLRHAFDAKNMKVLLQKILKGVYPPIPTGYSQELSSLIQCILVKDELKRPSVTQLLETPYLQQSLKLTYYSLTQMTAEEENSSRVARRAAAELMEATGATIQTTAKRAAVKDTQKEAKNIEELKSFRGMERGDLRKLLQGPPPAEVLEKTKKEPTPPPTTQQTQQANSSSNTTTTNESSVIPVCSSVIPSSQQPIVPPDQNSPRGLKLAERQYNTLKGQLDTLMCLEGHRCRASEEDNVVGDNPSEELQSVEYLRKNLLESLGEDKFEIAYIMLKGLKDPEAESEDIMASVEYLLGDKAHLVVALSHLISLEEAQRRE